MHNEELIKLKEDMEIVKNDIKRVIEIIEGSKTTKGNKRKRKVRTANVSEDKVKRIEEFIYHIEREYKYKTEVLASTIWSDFTQWDFENGYGGKIDTERLDSIETENYDKMYGVNNNEFGSVFSKYYDKKRSAKGNLYIGVPG